MYFTTINNGDVCQVYNLDDVDTICVYEHQDKFYPVFLYHGMVRVAWHYEIQGDTMKVHRDTSCKMPYSEIPKEYFLNQYKGE